MGYPRRQVVRRLLTVLSVCLLLGAASGVPAQADPFGELQSFGEAELKSGGVPRKAFGVDPGTNDVYEVEQVGEKSFKLIQFAPGASGYAIDATTAAFTPTDPSTEGVPDEIEGVAIDQKLHRAYVLALEERKEELIDPEKPAAGTLYAFSTIPSSKGVLEPAAETTRGALVKPEAFKPLSNTPGVSLIEPGGIAVDPSNDDIVIAANVDRGLKASPAEEEEETSVVQRIHSDGTFGARYLAARTEAPEPECGCLTSPVVSATGAVYVLGEGSEIFEFPTPSSATVPPETVPVTPVVRLKFNFGCEMECRFGSKLETGLQEKLVQIPEEKGPGQGQQSGSNLSISPEGDIWARSRVKYQLAGPEQEFEYGGATEFTSEFAEQGWTGGESLAVAAGKCVIDDLQESPAIAAGSGGSLFVLDLSPANSQQGESKGPRIIEFGPGGNGCPHPTATLEAHAGGVPLGENEPLELGEKVTLSSPLLQANALSTEWEFEPGVKVTVSKREEQGPKIEHAFANEGLFTVKETIHTDNLAEPEIKLQRKIDSVGKPTPVTGVAVVAGTSVTLKGTVNPNGLAVQECFFEYGPTTSYGTDAPCVGSLGSGLEPKEVTAVLAGLPKHAEFHFRLVAKNATGENEGLDAAFTTGPAPKVVVEGATAVGTKGATLNATVDPEAGEVTKCQFEYGTSTSYGTVVPCSTPPGSGENTVAESLTVVGLAPNTTYHYRVVATNSGGTGEGSDQEFSTAPEEFSTGPGNSGGNEEAQHKAEAEAAQRKAQEEAAAKKRQEEEAATKNNVLGTKSKTPTRAQLLAQALKVCKKEPKKKRAKCEAAAKKKYGPKKKTKKKK